MRSDARNKHTPTQPHWSPAICDIIAEQRAAAVEAALAPVRALADEWTDSIRLGRADNPDGHSALTTHERDLDELLAVLPPAPTEDGAA